LKAKNFVTEGDVMAIWTMCHTPDWANKASGMFVRNPLFKHTRRFWHNASTQETQSSGDPPNLHQKNYSDGPDQVAIGIEVDDPAGSPRYTVTSIMVDCSAKGKNAGQASPFQGGGRMLCTISGAPNPVVGLLDEDGNLRHYSTLGPLDLFRDSTNKISEYELTIVATLQENGTGNLFDFSIDPEMDVDNTP
jgi:hypothetical protein